MDLKEAAPSDVDLMIRARGGDQFAFEQLHARYYVRIQDFFYGLSRNRDLSYDLCQETFLRVWKLRGRYKPTGSFPAYLFTFARHIWLEQCRAFRKDQRFGARVDVYSEAWGPAGHPNARPDVGASNAEVQAAIDKAVAALPEEQRMVFIMRTVLGMSLADVAEAMNCPQNTVRSRKLLAIRKLREKLGHVFGAVSGVKEVVG